MAPPERGHAPDPHDPGDPHPLLGPARDHADRLPHAVSVPFGGVVVDPDLARAGGPLAGDQRERVEALVAVWMDAEGEPGGAAGRQHLAVAADQVGGRGDAPLCLLDPVQRTDLPEQRFGEGRRDRAFVFTFFFDRAARRDDDVGALIDFLEDGPEGGFDRVREDVGAADHRDPEHDRDGRQDGPQLARAEAL